jgi:hypothetical protein
VYGLLAPAFGTAAGVVSEDMIARSVYPGVGAAPSVKLAVVEPEVSPDVD